MPDCPYCRAPCEDNDLFCRSCGASLKLPEYDRAFCPHCGARVGARQEFCHECHWSLVKPESAAVPPPYPGKPSLGKRPGVWAAFIVAGVLIALLPWLFFSGPPSGPGPRPRPPEGAPAQPGVGPTAPGTPPAPAAPEVKAPVDRAVLPPAPTRALALKKELEELLLQLREAQLKKDLSLYMQSFSPNLPDLEARRQKTLAVWQAYDYTGLEFKLEEVKPLAEDYAEALVAWTLKFQQKGAPGGKTETQTYKVHFSKEAGKWRVSNLERVRRQD